MKKEAKAYVTAAVKSVTAAMKKDPTMSVAKQKALTTEAIKATAAYQKQAMAKIVQEVTK